MNKKGEEADTRTAIIPVIIAVVVIIVVIMGAVLIFGGKIDFVKFLPSFNQTQENVYGVEILRYNIQDNKVQFYDGARWNDFESSGAIVINKKEFKYSDVRESFYKYFHAQRGGEVKISKQGVFELKDIEIEAVFYLKEYQLPAKPSRIFESAWIYWFGDGKIGQIQSKSKAGDVLVYVKSVKVGEKDYNLKNGMHYCVLHEGIVRTNEGKFEALDPQGSSDDDEQRVIDSIWLEAKKWREKVFEKPLVLYYTNKNTDKMESIYSCFEERYYKQKGDLVFDVSSAKAGLPKDDEKCSWNYYWAESK